MFSNVANDINGVTERMLIVCILSLFFIYLERNYFVDENKSYLLLINKKMDYLKEMLCFQWYPKLITRKYQEQNFTD